MRRDVVAIWILNAAGFLVALLALVVMATTAHCQTQRIEHYAPSGKLVSVEGTESDTVGLSFGRHPVPGQTPGPLGLYCTVHLRPPIRDTLKYGCPTCGSEDAEELLYVIAQEYEGLSGAMRRYTCTACGCMYAGRRRK